jgi:Ca-activated chloride channel homolog
MRYLLILLSCILSLHAFAGGSNKKGNNNSCVLSGIVTDAISKKPVESVQVTVYSTATKTEQKVFTDKQGRFKLAQLPAGNVSFRLSKEDYTNFEKNVTLSAETPATLNIQLNPDKDDEVLQSPKATWERFQII